MVIVEGLTKYYGDFLALDAVSFSFQKGDVVGLLGPNGAGKSTTMKILSGFMPQTSGKVSIHGIDVSLDPIEIKKRIGFLPEIAPLYLDMKVKAYLSYVAELKRVEKIKIKAQVDEAIEQTNLKEVENKTIKTLSKGYKQRVGIAQALLGNPDLIILDEPTVGLDPKQVIEIRALIKQLAVNRTLLLSSHILSEVEAVCNKVIIMNKGKMVATELVSDLTSKTTEQKYEIKIKDNFDLSSIDSGKIGISRFQKGDDGYYELYVNGSMELHEIMRLLVEQKIPFTDLRKKETRLEDVYLQLVQKED